MGWKMRWSSEVKRKWGRTWGGLITEQWTLEDNRSGNKEVTMQLIGRHVRFSFYVIIHCCMKTTVWRSNQSQIQWSWVVMVRKHPFTISIIVSLVYLPNGQGWNASHEYCIGLLLLMAHFYTFCPLCLVVRHISKWSAIKLFSVLFFCYFWMSEWTCLLSRNGEIPVVQQQCTEKMLRRN